MSGGKYSIVRWELRKGTYKGVGIIEAKERCRVETVSVLVNNIPQRGVKSCTHIS